MNFQDVTPLVSQRSPADFIAGFSDRKQPLILQQMRIIVTKSLKQHIQKSNPLNIELRSCTHGQIYPTFAEKKEMHELI